MEPELVPVEYLDELLSLEGEYLFVFSSVDNIKEFVREFYKPTEIYGIKAIINDLIAEVKSCVRKLLKILR